MTESIPVDTKVRESYPLIIGKLNNYQSQIDAIELLPGPTPYEEWLSRGNIGTYAEFLATLKGEPGATDHGALTGLTIGDPHTQYSLTDGTRGNFAPSGHTHAEPSHIEYSMFYQDGPLAIKTGVRRDPVFEAGTLTAIRATINTAPVGSGVGLSVNINGVEAATLVIPAGLRSAAITGLTATLVAGDYLTVDIDSTGTEAADLTVKAQTTH